MNLVQTAHFVRKAVIVFAAALVFYILFLIVREPTRLILRALFPPRNEPNIAYGVLDQLEFTPTSILDSEPTYILNTRNGQLPQDLPSVIRVYKYIPPKFSYGSGEKAQIDASKFGFTDEMRTSKLTDETYTWADVTFGGDLEINTNNNTLALSTPLFGKGSLFPAGKLSKQDAIDSAIGLLDDLSRFYDPLYKNSETRKEKVVFGKFGPSGVVRADSLQEAQIARVDIFRQIDTYPVLGDDPKHALLQVYVRASNGKETPQLNYPMASIYHWELDTEEIATYPTLPISLAWQQVAQGSGVIVNATPDTQSPFKSSVPVVIDKILINDIYVAYYDTKNQQKIMQPIYVFEGNYTSGTSGKGDITIYYPAISGEHVYNPEQSQDSDQILPQL